MPNQSSFPGPGPNPNSGNGSSITLPNTNLPIAIHKGVRNCIKHRLNPISQLYHVNLISSLSSICFLFVLYSIPEDWQQAVEDHK